MTGVKPIFRKELTDHLSSYRFLILFVLIAMASLILVYMAAVDLEENLRGEQKPRYVFLMLFTSSRIGFPLVQFVAFFGPLIGLLLGFDSVNREHNEGTLSKLLAQPIYRDAVINGKWAAGAAVVAIMLVSIVLLIVGMGLILVGVKPGGEEFARIFIYLLISTIYISLWLGVSILFSILFRNVATSALAVLAVWVFFSFFLSLGVNALAGMVVSTNSASQAEALRRLAAIERALTFTSPMKLYTDSTATIIDPMRRTLRPFIVQMGLMERISMSRFSGPLPLLQSFLMVSPYIIYLVALTVVSFALSYVIFMRQEIRSI
jgi:ABC-2 type transport system permease protein